jgi:hypothetical protein
MYPKLYPKNNDTVKNTTKNVQWEFQHVTRSVGI